MAAMTKAQLLRQAQSWWLSYGPQVAEMLGMDSPGAPKFVVLPSHENPAFTANGVITLSLEWFNDNPNDIGAIIHEGVHYLQEVQNPSKQTRKQIEPIADAVRARLGFDNDGKWKPDAKAARLAELRPWELAAVSKAMVTGEFSNSFLNKLEDGRITRQEYEGVKADPKMTFQDASSAYSSDTARTQSREQGNFGAAVQPPALSFTPAPRTGSINADTASTGSREGGGTSSSTGGGVPFVGEGEGTSTGDGSVKDAHRARIAFYVYLQDLGIGLTSNINQLVHEAARRGYDATTFEYYLRQTPEYKAAEAQGKTDADAERARAEHEAMVKQFLDIMGAAHLDGDKSMVNYAISKGVTPSEFAERVQAQARLNRDKQLFEQFEKELVDNGLAKRGKVDRKDMLKFALGTGNEDWYDLWQDAVTRNAAVQAGIQVGKKAFYTGLNDGTIERISNLGLDESSVREGFAQVADQLANTLPLSEARAYGLSKQDIVRATFGGKRSAQARRRITKVQKTAEAFDQDRASEGFGQRQDGGLGQSVNRGTTSQQSEF